MNSDSYKQAYTAVQQELAELTNQRFVLEKRIAKLKQTLVSLETLITDDESEPSSLAVGLRTLGITDACRHALKVANKPRTAIDVRDWLEASGYDLDQENALASIHTILKRLVSSGEADGTIEEDGKTYYRWKSLSKLERALVQTVESVEKDLRGLANLNRGFSGYGPAENIGIGSLGKKKN